MLEDLSARHARKRVELCVKSAFLTGAPSEKRRLMSPVLESIHTTSPSSVEAIMALPSAVNCTLFTAEVIPLTSHRREPSVTFHNLISPLQLAERSVCPSGLKRT